jgi:hypothetical protein
VISKLSVVEASALRRGISILEGQEESDFRTSGSLRFEILDLILQMFQLSDRWEADRRPGNVKKLLLDRAVSLRGDLHWPDMQSWC